MYATDQFLDVCGGLTFDRVKFRPKADFTSPFGLDDTFKTLRIHNAIDRSKDANGLYPIYNPFTAERAQYIKPYSSYGTLLILTTVWGFQVRIAHIEKLSNEMELAMVYNAPIKAGIFIGEAGQAGESKGRHTHVEIVSLDSSCQVLDEVLKRKYGTENLETEYTEKDIDAFASGRKLTGDSHEVYKAEREKRNVFFLNEYICDRIDYHTGKPRRFYSSRALFGM